MTTSTVPTETLKDFIKGQGHGVAPSAVVAICEQLLAVREAQGIPIGCIKTISDNKTLKWWRDAPEGAEVFTAPPALTGWITCSERMPTDETTVLVSNEEGVVWIADVDHGGQFYPDEFPVAKMSAGEITHWMPIPAAPTPTK